MTIFYTKICEHVAISQYTWAWFFFGQTPYTDTKCGEVVIAELYTQQHKTEVVIAELYTQQHKTEMLPHYRSYFLCCSKDRRDTQSH